MKKRLVLLAVLVFLLMFPVVGSAKKKDPLRATPNLSFPIIATLTHAAADAQPRLASRKSITIRLKISGSSMLIR